MATYHARDLLRVPGMLSLSRLLFAVAFALVVHRPWPALGVLAFAGLSDVLDGWYARRFRQTTATGALADALLDKFFVGAVAVTLIAAGRLSLPELLLLGLRDIGELAIGLGLAFRKERARLADEHRPGVFGKVTTALQYVVVGTAVFGAHEATMAFAIVTGVVGLLAAASYARAESKPA